MLMFAFVLLMLGAFLDDAETIGIYIGIALPLFFLRGEPFFCKSHSQMSLILPSKKNSIGVHVPSMLNDHPMAFTGVRTSLTT